MKLGATYTGTIDYFQTIGRKFTGDNGTKYINYQVWLEGSPVSYLMTLPESSVPESGDEIEFKFTLDKKKKFRLTNIQFEKYKQSFSYPDMVLEFKKVFDSF